MKNVLLFSILLICAACNSQDAVSNPDAIYERVDNATFKTKMSEPNTVLLDVRTPAETNKGVIGDAVLIDYRAADFKEKIAALDRDKTYLVYCQSGGRSARTAKIMQELGFNTIYELATGYGRWEP